MIFNIITIFPKMFESYFSESILARAQKEKLIEIKIHNLRDYTTDKHQTVDDTPYGGGAGMVMKVEPIWRCVQDIQDVKDAKDIEGEQNNLAIRTILFSAKGKKYTQRDAERLAKYDKLILICGRYEGVDERVAEHIADEEISVGEYVLTGGEVPAMIIVDSVSRLLPNVLGNAKSLEEESHGNVQNVESVQSERATISTNGTIQQFQQTERCLEYPQYTKPEEFKGWKVPKILLGGNHQKIKNWRNEQRK